MFKCYYANGELAGEFSSLVKAKVFAAEKGCIKIVPWYFGNPPLISNVQINKNAKIYWLGVDY